MTDHLSQSVASTYRAKLDEFKALKPDWDSYGGVPGDPDTLRAARVFLDAVIEGAVDLVPLADGGVQIECHRKGFDIEVEFEPRKANAEHGDTIGYWERAT